MRWVKHVARIRDMRSGYKVVVGKPEGKRPFGRHRCRWKATIRMNLKEIGQEGVDWIYLA
jgi:hypothetical protein